VRIVVLVSLLSACGTGSSPAPDVLPGNDITAVPPHVLFTYDVTLWLDAAEPGTFTGERWADRSAHGHDAVAQFEPYAPASSQLAGLPAVTFDGIDDRLLVDSMSSMRGPTIYVVAATHSANGPVVSTLSCPTSEGVALLVQSNQAAVVGGTQVGYHLRVNSHDDGHTVIENDRWFVARVQTSQGDITEPALALGSELIVVNRGMSLMDILEIERYLAQKWHVTQPPAASCCTGRS
jgi:hypothetical protein